MNSPLQTILRSIGFAAMFLALAWPKQAAAHEPKGDTFRLAQRIAIWERAMILAPEITNYDEHVTAVPVLNFNGTRVYLNSGFWGLVTQIQREYFAEWQRDCVGCTDMTADQLVELTQEQVARGYWTTQVLQPLLDRGSHLIESAAEAGSQSGPAAGVAIVAFEVAEEATVALVMPGAHVLCSVGQFCAFKGSGLMNSGVRMVSLADNSIVGIDSLVQRLGISNAIRRVQHQVEFVTGPIELDLDAIGEIDTEGPGRFLHQDGRRDVWLRGIEAENRKKVEDLLKIENEIQAVVNKDAITERQLRKRDRAIARLRARADNLIAEPDVVVDRRQFFGKRYWRTFGVFARRQSYLRGNTLLDRNVKKGFMWIMRVQEGILHRGLYQARDPARLEASTETVYESRRRIERQYTPRYAPDSIRESLAIEYSIQRLDQAATIDRLLQDIEAILDPAVPQAERYVLIQEINLYFQVEYFKSVSESVDQILGYQRLSFFQRVRFLWTLGGFSYAVKEFIDHLASNASSKNPDRLESMKYESMEYFLDLMGHVEYAKQLSGLRRATDAVALRELMAGYNAQLKARRPWRDKVTRRSWVPGRQLVVRCEDLDAAI